MVPTARRNQKEDLKSQITQIIETIRAYESCTMTQQTSIELKELKKNYISNSKPTGNYDEIT
jgi:hypothetical protein